MLGRRQLLEISQRAAAVLRDTQAADRYRHRGYTRIDPFEIADEVDIEVMLRPLQDLLGAFLREAQPGILVNAERPPGLVHMTCAHELGHFFLGHETTTDRQLDYGPEADPIEKAADWFAYHLLMPRNLVADLIRRKGWKNRLKDPFTLYQLSLRLGTSYSATIWTLWHLNVLGLSATDAKALTRIAPQSLKRELVGGSDETLSDVWVLDKADKDLILEPRPTDKFVLDLPSHISAGYLWALADAEDAGFTMRPVTRVGSPTGFAHGDPIVVGGVTQQRYLLEAHGAERADAIARVNFEFREQQPWRTDQPAHDAFRTAAEFETIELGLTARGRERLIDEVSAS